MSLSNISPGNDIPNEINVVIEIPTNAEPVKYEVDKNSGALFVDRFLNTAMFYPCNYGYMPGTLSEDGDPIDVLVVTPARLLSGAIIAVRPVGILKMTDEKGVDAKILAVPTTALTSLYQDVKSPEDLPKQLLETISHFFEHYKDLEPGKWVKLEGWEGAEAARMEINSSVERYRSTETA